ncbi:MAG: hypothetical protein QGF33_13960, partial [Alphaproteobacteria bacterium]|nr:hypothetical protein [Alphaproteobacteria bacterium]
MARAFEDKYDQSLSRALDRGGFDGAALDALRACRLETTSVEVGDALIARLRDAKGGADERAVRAAIARALLDGGGGGGARAAVATLADAAWEHAVALLFLRRAARGA